MTPQTLTDTISKGYTRAINKIGIDQAEAELVRVIHQLHKDAGAKNEIDAHLLDRLIEIMINDFKHLAPFEIITAFTEYMKDPTTANGRGEFYGGQLNVRNFLGIMGWYNAKRLPIIRALQVAKSKEEDTKINIMNDKQKEFEATFIADVVKARQNIEIWQDVPLWWYDALNKREMMPVDKNLIGVAWQQSEVFAKLEVKNRVEGTTRKLTPSVMIEKSIDKDQIRKNIARRIYMLEVIVKNENWPNCHYQ